MLLAPVGMPTMFSLVQFSKQLKGMYVMLFGRIAWVRPVQPEKAPRPREVRLLALPLKSG